MNNTNDKNKDNSSQDNSLVFRDGTNIIKLNVDAPTRPSSSSKKKSKKSRSTFVLTDEMFQSDKEYYKRRSSSHSRYDTSRGVIDLPADESESSFKAVTSIKKSEHDLELLPKKQNEFHIKKSGETLNIPKQSKDKTDSSLLFRTKTEIVEIKDLTGSAVKPDTGHHNIGDSLNVDDMQSANASVAFRDSKRILGIIDNDGLNAVEVSRSRFNPFKIILKNYYKFQAKRKAVVKSERRISIENFLVRILEIWSLLLLANFVTFAVKPVFNKLTQIIFGAGNFNAVVPLTFRYLLVWLLIILICLKTTYNLGYRETRDRNNVPLPRVAAIFALADIFYIAVAIFFMNLIKPAPLLGALALNGVYISALVTNAKTLTDLAGKEYTLLNLGSIAATIQIAIIPMLVVFIKGGKDRIFIRDTGKLPREKKRRFFVIDEADQTVKASIKKK